MNKSIVQLLDGQDLLMESEAWFGQVVGLQNWSIDPRKDVNHVYNKDLLLLFQDKVSHKGYSWKSYKFEKVRNMMKQLYKPLFQILAMPKDGYVSESFTHAVVSGVFYFTSINWALLGEKKWRAKTNHKEVIVYNEGVENVTYNNVIVEKLERDVSITDNAIESLEQEYAKASAKVDEVRSSPKSLARAEKKKVVDEELQRLKSKLEVEKWIIKYAKRMIAIHGAGISRVVEHKGKLSINECLVQTIHQQIEELEALYQKYSSDYPSALDSIESTKKAISLLRSRKEVKIKQI